MNFPQEHRPVNLANCTRRRVIVTGCRSVLLFCTALALSGCGDFRLVQKSSGSIYRGEAGWYADGENRLDPQTSRIIADAAGSRGVSGEGDHIAVFLESYGGADLVALMDNVDHTQERFGLKQVSYARVRAGKVVRLSQPQMEPAPDPEFERALYLAAVRAGAEGTSVVPYNDPNGAVTLRGTTRGRCHVEVKVLNGQEFGAEALFTVRHNVCQERQTLVEEASNR